LERKLGHDNLDRIVIKDSHDGTICTGQPEGQSTKMISYKLKEKLAPSQIIILMLPISHMRTPEFKRQTVLSPTQMTKSIL
jgi:hypothetical protein